MNSTLTRRETPEERELAAKKAVLAALEAHLGQRELDLATLRVELHAFEQRYIRIVGAKFREIDELEAQIAEALNRRNPSDEAASHAASARKRATESAAVADALQQYPNLDDFKPSDDLKRLYREIAKRIHPDLATDDEERAKRTRLMADANRAYAKGDETRLRAILDEWETSPDAVTGNGVGAELIRTIRKIHQVQRRLADIEAEIAALNGADLAQLKTRVESEQEDGRDVLADMAHQLDIKIRALEHTRDELRHQEASS